jgi:hypothetical protein
MGDPGVDLLRAKELYCDHSSPSSYTQGVDMHEPEPVNKTRAKQERSEGLLPADDATADGRLEVAEEVNLDQQSDAARRVGQPPAGHVGAQPGPVADAMAEALSPPAPEDAAKPSAAPANRGSG